jgi:serine/threonine protein kinase
MNELTQALQHPSTIEIGRYLLHRQIARGGMATIHIARLVGDEGFTRIVAAKRLHPEFAEDGDFVSMFLDEARIASKVHHRNVVPVLDVVTTGQEVMLVQEYVHGAPLHTLLRTAHEAKTRVPINIAVSIGCQVLSGLQAAHETTDELGAPLAVVHRDVSPQNVMIATDGTARLLDFGIAKATMAAHITREGMFKGKLAYSAPEQIRGQATQQSDLYSLSVVVWELLVGHRLHNNAQSEAELIGQVMAGRLARITEVLAPERDKLGDNRWRQLEILDAIIAKGLEVDQSKRWRTAAEMEAALATAVVPATTTGVSGWIKNLGHAFLADRDRMIAQEEASYRALPRPARRPSQGPHTELRTVAAMPAAPVRHRTRLVVGAAAVGLMLALVFVIGMTRGSAPLQAAVAAPVTSPLAPPSTVAMPSPVATPSPVAVAPPVKPAPLSSISTAAGTGIGESRAAPRPIANVARTQRVVIRPVRPAPREAAHEATPAPAVEPAKADCSPPYYFDGAKKIFKPACL